MVRRKVFAVHKTFPDKALNIAARIIEKSGARGYGKKFAFAEELRGKDWKHPYAQKLFLRYTKNYLFRNPLSSKQQFESLLSASLKAYDKPGIDAKAAHQAVKKEVYKFVSNVAQAKRADRVAVVRDLHQELDHLAKRLDLLVNLYQTGEEVSKVEQAGKYKVNPAEVKYYHANASDAIGHIAVDYVHFLNVVPSMQKAAKELEELFNIK